MINNAVAIVLGFPELPYHRHLIKNLHQQYTLRHLMFVGPCIVVQFIKKNPKRCNNVSKVYYSTFIWSSTCFGRHTAHQQEPKTALAASGFSYVKGCWTCRWRTLSGTVCHHLHVQRPFTYEKPEAVRAVLGSCWWAVCRSKHVEFHINVV
jgi:hypothetical protein